MSKHTNSSANIRAARDTWSLGATVDTCQKRDPHVRLRKAGQLELTDDQRNHGGSISTRRL